MRVQFPQVHTISRMASSAQITGPSCAIEFCRENFGTNLEAQTVLVSSLLCLCVNESSNYPLQYVAKQRDMQSTKPGWPEL